MGDIIHSLPVAAALRQAYPAAHIGWAIEERWAELLGPRSEWGTASASSAKKPLVDSIHIVKMKSWLAAPFSREGWRERRRMKAEMRTQDYGAAIDIQGALKSVWVARVSNASQRIGFSTPREPIAKYFYSPQKPMRGAHVLEQGWTLGQELAGRSAWGTDVRLPRA